MIIGAIFLSEGLEGFKPFLNVEALLVVMGGTFSALLVNYPLSQIVGLGKVLQKVLTGGGEETSEIVTTFVALSQKAKKQGFLALEEDVKKIKNDFLKRG